MTAALVKRLLKLEQAFRANAPDPIEAMTDEELDAAIEELMASLDAFVEANPNDPAAPDWKRRRERIDAAEEKTKRG
ncbi:hypothetical protein ACLNGM_20275 [Aureimonas phyllosphaerae]|uniref:hypothetical protein n=1 Tax=Aureimonas phyllosphaerae TaxID=1166078 RepID=UPI003A5BF29D